MSQTKLGSFVEALMNVVIGITIGFVTNLLVLPLFGYNITPADALGVGAIFTAISIVRSYYLRRIFNRIKTNWNRVQG